ncbi:MAG: hypothetical protein ABSH50_19015 [Bryobacteraceae bacterium]
MIVERLRDDFPGFCTERVRLCEAVTFGNESGFRETLNVSWRRCGKLLDLDRWQTETELYTQSRKDIPHLLRLKNCVDVFQSGALVCGHAHIVERRKSLLLTVHGARLTMGTFQPKTE